jgi:hypothetical protein
MIYAFPLLVTGKQFYGKKEQSSGEVHPFQNILYSLGVGLDVRPGMSVSTPNSISKKGYSVP